MTGYVIYLSSTNSTSRHLEHYGYWTGEHYQHQGKFYPICEEKITENTKIYKYEITANNAAERAFKKFGEVSRFMVLKNERGQ
ncbi:hypothetical protein CEY02_20685 [Bacillus pumilus]|uniref:Uncharacterized protein n=1 Tax=Bacillus pumilus TaxID=1408 RepID=A0A2A5IEM3_BACPU|nr:hypothetical protein [Bacillus pumilus]PCK15532.1 hypothetical protein CEY02_20685 [Bacillus pumilus]